jgi:hypothetical protein
VSKGPERYYVLVTKDRIESGLHPLTAHPNPRIITPIMPPIRFSFEENLDPHRLATRSYRRARRRMVEVWEYEEE